jgi:predicted amidohydrolase
MKRSIRAASVQFEHSGGHKEANLSKIESFLELASSRGVELILFPECCITGYWFMRKLSKSELLALAEPIPGGDSSQLIISFARHYRMLVGAGLVEVDEEGRLYNSYVVTFPDGRYYRHRKLHCFINEHMHSGDGYTVFDTDLDVRMAVLTCYDNNIGENVRMCALKGAQVLCAPHQTGGCRSSNPHTMGLIERELWDNRRENPTAAEREFRGPKGREWLMRWLPARAHDNGMFLIFSNGVGVDDDEVRPGGAMIIDPYGRILAETWKADDDMVVADLDPSLLEENTGQRWIKTRRPELYGPLAIPTGQEMDTRSVRFDSKGV